MEATVRKTFTNEELSKVHFVQNISGGLLRIPDLLEGGKDDDTGISLDVDEVLDLASLVTDRQKIRMRILRRNLEGLSATRSFDAIKPTLRMVSSLNDPKRIQTAIVGSRIPLTGSVTAAPGTFQIKIMEQQLAELQYDLKTTKAPGAAATMKMTIENLKKEIEKAKTTIKQGLDSNIVVLENPESVL